MHQSICRRCCLNFVSPWGFMQGASSEVGVNLFGVARWVSHGGGAEGEAGVAGSGGFGAGVGVHGHERVLRAAGARGCHGRPHPPRRGARGHVSGHCRRVWASHQRSARGQAIKGIREKVQLATKFAGCIDEKGNFSIRGDPEYVRSACDASLKRLDVDYIDLYYQHIVDTKVPIEITVGAMKELVKERRVKYLGLSEASALDIRRAHAVHPITAVQMEWSQWARDVEEDIVPTCRELGIGIVSYSPLGRGFFAGYKPSEAQEGDFRSAHERFSGDNLKKNERLRQRVLEIAEKKKCSINQLALAWVLHKGNDLVPIPGTTKRKNLDSNIDSLQVSLTEEEIAQLEAAVPPDEIAGERYNAAHLHLTWRYASTPPLSSWELSSS